MEALLELLQQVDDLSLDGDVEGGDGLVTHDEVRLEGQGAGDADALALAAGELVGVAVGEDRVKPDQTQQLFHPLPGLLAPGDPVDLQGFGDDLAHGHARVQGGIGVLEDDLHATPHAPQLASLQLRQIHPIEDHPPARRPVQLQDGPADGGLPATGFPDQPQGLPPPDLERHAIHRVDVADGAGEDDPPGDGEPFHQVLHSEQHLSVPVHRGLPVVTSTQQAIR